MGSPHTPWPEPFLSHPRDPIKAKPANPSPTGEEAGLGHLAVAQTRSPKDTLLAKTRARFVSHFGKTASLSDQRELGLRLRRSMVRVLGAGYWVVGAGVLGTGAGWWVYRVPGTGVLAWLLYWPGYCTGFSTGLATVLAWLLYWLSWVAVLAWLLYWLAWVTVLAWLLYWPGCSATLQGSPLHPLARWHSETLGPTLQTRLTLPGCHSSLSAWEVTAALEMVFEAGLSPWLIKEF